MRADTSLLAAVEDIVKHGTPGRRTEILRRITDFFVGSATGFTEQHIELFDAVFNELITEIETTARFELSVKLAGIGNAPRRVVRRLAQDDQIAIAGPLLQHSERLDEPDLLSVAKSKSQQHLLAISYRRWIAQPITDVLVRRGDREVIRNVAGNSGANLSQFGFAALVHKAEKDGILAEKIGQRADLPEPLLRDLFLQATRVVQKRLLATATPDSQAKIQRVLAEISGEFGTDPSAPNIAANQITGVRPSSAGNVDEAALAKCATEGRYDDTVAGLAALCKIPLANMHRILANKHAEPAIVACKALGFGWSTARAIILLQRNGLGVSSHSLESKYRHFEKLSASGAQDVMRLWHTIHGAKRTEAAARLP